MLLQAPGRIIIIITLCVLAEKSALISFDTIIAWEKAARLFLSLSLFSVFTAAPHREYAKK